MNCLIYPKQFESWWLSEAKRVLRHDDDKRCLDHARHYVQRLSDFFTTERGEGFQDYALNVKDLMGYGLFFFPQTYMRVRMVLTELIDFRKWSTEKGQSLRILDLGAGTGAGVCAVLEKFSDVFPKMKMELTAVDQSQSSLKILKQITTDLKSMWPLARVSTCVGDLQRFEPRDESLWDVVLVSFALNEAFEGKSDEEILDWARKWLRKLSGVGVLIFCEPATQEASSRLGRLRDRLLEEKVATVLAPCLHQEACPMLGEKTWCHEVRRWKVPESVDYLNRKLYRSIKDLKWSFLVLSKSKDEVVLENHLRLVAPMHELKGRIVTRGCAADGKLHSYEMQTRGMEKAEKEGVLSIERGNVLKWQKIKLLGDGSLRAEELPQVKFGFPEAE
jgi:ribosomal protein RSM22 (predicted rRNA methylase)